MLEVTTKESTAVEQAVAFSKLSVTSPTSQLILILQAFRHLTYVTAHSPTLPSLYLRHNSFSNPSLLQLRHSSFSSPSFASPTSQVFTYVTWRAAHAYNVILPENNIIWLPLMRFFIRFKFSRMYSF